MPRVGDELLLLHDIAHIRVKRALGEQQNDHERQCHAEKRHRRAPDYQRALQTELKLRIEEHRRHNLALRHNVAVALVKPELPPARHGGLGVLHGLLVADGGDVVARGVAHRACVAERDGEKARHVRPLGRCASVPAGEAVGKGVALVQLADEDAAQCVVELVDVRLIKPYTHAHRQHHHDREHRRHCREDEPPAHFFQHFLSPSLTRACRGRTPRRVSSLSPRRSLSAAASCAETRYTSI